MKLTNTLLDVYFTAFKNKDIEAVTSTLSDDVVLLDWVSSAVGKTNVLRIFTNIFETFKSIDVDIIDVITEGNRFSIELLIVLDETIINVIDVIHIRDNKITKINAFKQ